MAVLGSLQDGEDVARGSVMVIGRSRGPHRPLVDRALQRNLSQYDVAVIVLQPGLPHNAVVNEVSGHRGHPRQLLVTSEGG